MSRPDVWPRWGTGGEGARGEGAPGEEGSFCEVSLSLSHTHTSVKWTRQEAKAAVELTRFCTYPLEQWKCSATDHTPSDKPAPSNWRSMRLR